MRAKFLLIITVNIPSLKVGISSSFFKIFSGASKDYISLFVIKIQELVSEYLPGYYLQSLFY